MPEPTTEVRILNHPFSQMVGIRSSSGFFLDGGFDTVDEIHVMLPGLSSDSEAPVLCGAWTSCNRMARTWAALWKADCTQATEKAKLEVQGAPFLGRNTFGFAYPFLRRDTSFSAASATTGSIESSFGDDELSDCSDVSPRFGDARLAPMCGDGATSGDLIVDKTMAACAVSQLGAGGTVFLGCNEERLVGRTFSSASSTTDIIESCDGGSFEASFPSDLCSVTVASKADTPKSR